jgi:hypothetical protein
MGWRNIPIPVRVVSIGKSQVDAKDVIVGGPYRGRAIDRSFPGPPMPPHWKENGYPRVQETDEPGPGGDYSAVLQEEGL